MDTDFTLSILSGEKVPEFPDVDAVFKEAALVIHDSEDDVPTWVREGHKSHEDYCEYWALTGNDMYQQAKDKGLPRKRNWPFIEKRLEQLNEKSLSHGNPSDRDLALLASSIEKSISLQLEGRPRPYFEPLQVADEQFTAGLNFYKDMVCDSQKFDLKLAHALLNAKKFGIGFLKVTIDTEDPTERVIGQEGKIIIKSIDPRFMWIDPCASSWEDAAYIICAEPMDLEEARIRYPEYASKIKPDGASLGEADDERQSRLASVAGDYGDRTLGKRDRVTLKEIWMRDNTKHFVPMLDPDDNPVLDEDGTPLGEYVRTYPNGRVVIIAGDEMVFNQPNPYRHGRFPFIALLDRVSSQVFPTSDCEALIPMEDRLSVLHKDMYKNMRANINAPWKTDTQTFDSADKYDQLSAEEGSVIIMNPGGQVDRMSPQEIPQSAFNLLGWMQSVYNDQSGVSNINQGQIQKGAQLSVDALENLQGASSSNLKMKQQLLEMFLKDFGYILQWNVRELCTSEQTFELNDPSSGQPKTISWKGREQPGYSINVQVTSSLPGNKAGAMQTSVSLWKEDLIDRQAALDQIKYPNRGEIIKRMQEREEKLAALGIEAKMRNKSGSPGRRSN